jgi:hypothetical protein
LRDTDPAAKVEPNLVNPAISGPAGYDGGNTLVYELKPVGGAGEGDLDPVNPDPKNTPAYGFGGHYNGNGYFIYNAFYNQQPTDFDKGLEVYNEVGIFGSLHATGTVENLNTSGGYIGACMSVGGIVGRSWGHVINCRNGNFVYGIGPNGTGGVVGASYTQLDETPPESTEQLDKTRKMRLADGTVITVPLIDSCSNIGIVISHFLSTHHGGHHPDGGGGDAQGHHAGSAGGGDAQMNALKLIG